MCKKTLIIMVLPLIVLGAEWQALDGPLTGLAEDMSMGLYQSQWVVYAADAMYYLYKSTNGGASWDSIYSPPAISEPACVITEKDNAQIVYIGKQDDTYPVWKSTDGGDNWASKSTGINNSNNNKPLCIAMHPDYPETLLIGFERYDINDECLFRTTNGGDQWTNCSVTYPVRDIWIHPDDPLILYIATNDSIRKSTDCGASWTKLPAPSSDAYDTYCIAVNTDATPESLFAIIEDWQDGRKKIYRTTNDGDDWTLLYTFPEGPNYDVYLMPTGLEIEKNTSGQTMYATIRPLGFYKSTDYGASWSASNDGIGDKHLYSLIQHPSTAGCLFAGGCMAVYKSTDYGGTWSEITKGMRLTEVVKITELDGTIWSGAYCPEYTCLYNDSPISGLVKSDNGGLDWKFTHHADLHYVRDVEIAPSNSDIIFASYQQEAQVGSYIFRTTDCGSNWDLKYYQGDYDIKDLTISNSTPDSVRACGHQFPSLQHPWDYPKVWLTSDCGNNWTSYTFPFFARFYTIATDPEVSYTIYTVGVTPVTELAHGFERSTDGGENWGPVAYGCKRPIYEIAIDPFSTEIVYAAGDSGIFKSTNGAVSFEGKSSGLSDSLTIDLVIDPEEPAIIYALVQSDATSITNSLYCSVDGSAKWFQFTLPPGNNPPEYVFDIGMDNVNLDKLFAGTEKGAYVFYPQYKIKHLTSSANKATSTNSAKKIIRGGINDIWITYESAGAIYAVYSSDGGTTWSRKMEIGYGYNPAMSSDPNAETPIPGIVWWAPGDKDTIYFAKHVSGYNWTSPVAIEVSAENHDFGPPSFVISTDDTGRVVYEDDGSIYYTAFKISDPDPIDPEEVGSGKNPSIGFMLPGSNNPEIHLVWEDNKKIRYRSRTISGAWSDRETVSTNNSHNPSIEVAGSTVHIVWERFGDIQYISAVYTDGSHYWTEIEPFSTDYSLDYPVLSDGNAMSCVADVNGDYEIYFWYNAGVGWVGPINISNNPDATSDCPHIVHKQTVLGTTVYFTWTENNNPPYDVRFDNYTFGGSNPDEDLAFYIAEGGEIEASPFNRRRGGYTQYGPEFFKKIDYDSEYLEYKFEKLNPAREYAVAAYLYHEDDNHLSITVRVDNTQIDNITLPPDSLIICKEMLSENLYADGAVNVKIFGNDAVCAVLALYEYESESGEGSGGGPQDAGATPFNIDKLTLSISPNPVRKDVNIRYTLPQSTKVTLSIYDVAGRLARTLVNSTQKPGSYQQSFNTANLSQGVYFVRLHTGDKSIVEKVIFLR